MKMDKSTKLAPGKMRNKTGNDYTAGNSVTGPSHSPEFGTSKTIAVAHLPRRFIKTRTRRG